MTRRRWLWALVLMSACNAEVRFDPSFSCTGSTLPTEMPAEPDASIAGTCQQTLCSPGSVHAGAQHTCASIGHGTWGEGSVVCWGRNDRHQVSASDAPTVATPTLVPFGEAPLSLSASALHTCATSPPRLACWGSNAAGMLGWPLVDETYAEQVPFNEVGAPFFVATGAAHTCTLDDDGLVRCFGDNAFGQLGEVSDPYLVMRGAWITLTPGSAVAIDAGGLRTCVWDVNDGLLCWGRERAEHEPAEVPWVVPGVTALDGGESSLSVGASHACVIASGDVRCWGSNEHGELGVGTREAQREPGERVELPAPADAVSAGGWIPVEVASPADIEYGAPRPAHTCARLENGEVWCWGANEHGQLGDGTTEDRLSPVRALIDDPVTEVSTGGAHTCATTHDAIYCWGSNERAQLARDPTALPFSPDPLRVELR